MRNKRNNMRYRGRTTRLFDPFSICGGLLLLSVLTLLLSPAAAHAQDPMNRLKEETLSYFKPSKGRILSLSGKTITADLGEKAGVKKGMRFTVFREGTPFLHPVTKEPMGKVEAPVGKADVKDVTDENSTMEVVSGEVRDGDLVRVSGMKVRLLFFQDRKVDWSLAEAYYQLLKDSGRFSLLDTALDSGDDAKIVDEAKKMGAEAVLVLTSDESADRAVLKQRIIWTEDSLQFAETAVGVDGALLKELRTARSAMTPFVPAGDALLFFDLPFSATLLASGDLNGDGKQELIFGSGRELRVYTLGAGLVNTNELKGPSSDDFVWIDTMDINGDGKDEIVVTAIKGRAADVVGDSGSSVGNAGMIASYIYELNSSGFSLLWKSDLFLRVVPGQGLVGQKYDGPGGFGGPVFRISYDSGRFSTGDALKLPGGVNIYDFSFVEGTGGTKYVLAYDDEGYLNLYNNEGLRIWRSKEDYPGFRSTFRKTAPTIMVDRGEWSIKDRLYPRNAEFFVVKRIALAAMAKGLGYKSSQIRTLWWTGLTMEENTLIDGISGSVMDYVLQQDRLIVLSKPLFGLKPKNVLKGESPMGSMLYVYSLKGR
jgi:hypothetical protein